MRKDRLLKLADFLETVPRKNFDMRDWQTIAPTKPEGSREGGCGFAGCALGWGVHAKLFRGARIGMENHYGAWRAVLTYYGERHMEAAAKIFQIDEDDAETMFSPHLGGTPKQAAARIRKFVKSRARALRDAT